MNDRLGIASRTVSMPARLQLLGKLGVVVDLTIENDPDGTVLVADWLMAVSQINDAEATHSDADIPGNENAGVVGAAMSDLIIHSLNQTAFHGLV
jgi:hypothetical protein